MILSKTEQNHIENANNKIKGIKFSTHSIYENGTFEAAGIVQTVAISSHVNETTYPSRRYYNIKITRAYSNLPDHKTQYSFSVYVDEEELVTEITPLYIVNISGYHQRKQRTTKDDYASVVYRLFLGVETLK